jgi:hypothetical protein
MAAGKKQTEEQVARFADMFSALGTEPLLRIMRLLFQPQLLSKKRFDEHAVLFLSGHT